MDARRAIRWALRSLRHLRLLALRAVGVSAQSRRQRRRGALPIHGAFGCAIATSVQCELDTARCELGTACRQFLLSYPESCGGICGNSLAALQVCDPGQMLVSLVAVKPFGGRQLRPQCLGLSREPCAHLLSIAGRRGAVLEGLAARGQLGLG